MSKLQLVASHFLSRDQHSGPTVLSSEWHCHI